MQSEFLEALREVLESIGGVVQMCWYHEVITSDEGNAILRPLYRLEHEARMVDPFPHVIDEQRLLLIPALEVLLERLQETLRAFANGTKQEE